MDSETFRHRVAERVFQQFAFASFVIWTGSCLLLFILFAAGNPRPIVPAMIAMTVPVVPAALIWVLYRPLVAWQVARRLRATSTAGSS